VALAGNPNTGKSTLFNAITGLRQHTGNWPGKTVELKWGLYRRRGEPRLLVDLPGTYSLLADSPEEAVARDFLVSRLADAVVAVADATSLSRTLALALEILELTPAVVLCVNLIDEARRRGLEVDTDALARELGIPAVATSAACRQGVEELLDAVEGLLGGRLPEPRTIGLDAAIKALLPPSAAALPPIGAGPRPARPALGGLAPLER
jgi:ferrous iron transport protein B